MLILWRLICGVVMWYLCDEAMRSNPGMKLWTKFYVALALFFGFMGVMLSLLIISTKVRR